MDHINVNTSKSRPIPSDATDESGTPITMIIWPYVADCTVITFKDASDAARAYSDLPNIKISRYSPQSWIDGRHLVLWDPLFSPPEWVVKGVFSRATDISTANITTIDKYAQMTLVDSLVEDVLEHRDLAARPVYESYEDSYTGLTVQVQGKLMTRFEWAVQDEHRWLPPQSFVSCPSERRDSAR